MSPDEPPNGANYKPEGLLQIDLVNATDSVEEFRAFADSVIEKAPRGERYPRAAHALISRDREAFPRIRKRELQAVTPPRPDLGKEGGDEAHRRIRRLCGSIPLNGTPTNTISAGGPNTGQR